MAFHSRCEWNGGANRDRTDDLKLAKLALSQLSYGPVVVVEIVVEVVGLGRLELPTSRLSSARSNQLSYKPVPGISHQESGSGQMHPHLTSDFLTTDP